MAAYYLKLGFAPSEPVLKSKPSSATERAPTRRRTPPPPDGSI
jgi:hypothetical protein